MPKKQASKTTPHTLISIDQAAGRFGLSARTVRRKIADGSLPAFRVGHQIRLDAVAAERALLEPMNAAASALLKGGDLA